MNLIGLRVVVDMSLIVQLSYCYSDLIVRHHGDIDFLSYLS